MRLWWGHREKYLTKQECSICEDVTLAQLTKNISKCQQLESNVGPNTKKQKTMRNEHEIYSADPEATAAHDSRRVRWRASPGRDGEGGDDLGLAGDVGILGDAQAGMSCSVAGQDPGIVARQAFAPRAGRGRSGRGEGYSAGGADADMAMNSFQSPSGMDKRLRAPWERERDRWEWERRRQPDQEWERRRPERWEWERRRQERWEWERRRLFEDDEYYSSREQWRGRRRLSPRPMAPGGGGGYRDSIGGDVGIGSGDSDSAGDGWEERMGPHGVDAEQSGAAGAVFAAASADSALEEQQPSGDTPPPPPLWMRRMQLEQLSWLWMMRQPTRAAPCTWTPMEAAQSRKGWPTRA